MKVLRQIAVTAAIASFFLLLLAPSADRWRAQASVTCNASGSSPYCPVVETENALTMDGTAPQYVYTSGYANPGDGGGGVLYVLESTSSCSSSANGGTIVSSTSGCYYAQTFPQNVLQWGAVCNARNPAVTGGIAGASSNFVVPNTNLTASSGQYIAISGAGAGGTTLGGQISGVTNVSGTATGSFTTTSNVMTLTGTTNIVLPGMGFTDPHFPSGTFVVATNLTSNTITLSSYPTIGGSNVTLNLSGKEISLGATTASSGVPAWYATNADVASSSETFSVGQSVTLTDNTVVVITAISGSGNTGTPLRARP